MSEETPLQKAVRLAKQQSQVSAPTNDMKDMSYDDYVASKKKVQTVSPVVSNNGSKTSGKPLPNSQNRLNVNNPFNGKTVDQYISPELKSQADAQMASESAVSQAMADSLTKIQQAYQGDKKQMSTAQASANSSPDKLEQGVADEDRSGNRAGFIYNEILNGVSDIASGLGDFGTQLMTRGLPGGGLPFQTNIMRSPEEEASANQAIKDYRENVAPKVRGFLKDNIGAEVDKVLENKYRDETFTGALGGLARTLPAISATAISGGVGSGALFMQAYDNGLNTLEQSEAGRNLDDATKTIYASGLGIVTTALEKLGLNTILKSEAGPISTYILNRAIKNASLETGEKITGDALSKFINKEIVDLSGKFAKGGVKAIDSYLTEFVTGSAQEGATIGAENLLNKTTGKPVFDMSNTDQWGEIVKRVVKAGNAEGIGGGLLGTVSALGGFKRGDVKEMEQGLSDIDTALANENISDVAKEVLVQNKIKLQNELQDVADEVDKKYDSLSDEKKQQVAQITEQKAKIEESILDVNVPEDAKKLLEAQSELLDKELADIKPEESLNEAQYSEPIETASERVLEEDAGLDSSKIKKVKWDRFGNEAESDWVVGELKETRGGRKAIELSKMEPDGIGGLVNTTILAALEDLPTELSRQFISDSEISSMATEPLTPNNRGKESIKKPSFEQKMEDVKNNNFVSFVYGSENEIPSSLKEKVSSKGENNGVKFWKVTLTKSEADYLLKNESISKKPVQVDTPSTNVETEVLETPTEIDKPKSYGYEDIDSMTNEKDVADNLYQEITEPTELSPIEQAIRNGGGFTTTQESYERFGDRNNIGQQMAKSYFKKGAQSLDQIAQEFSKDGLEVTPQDLVEYMDKFQDGNSTYSGRAKALQNKLQDLTGKKYNKFTVKKYIDKVNENARTKISENPDFIDQKIIDAIEEDNLTPANIEEFKDKIEFLYGEETFNNIKEYLNGKAETKTNTGTADVGSNETSRTSGEIRGLEEQSETEGKGTTETLKGTVLETSPEIKDAGYDFAVLPMNDGRFVAIEANSKKQVSKVYETEQEVIDAFESNKGKLTVDAIAEATGVKPKVVESKSDAPVKEKAASLSEEEVTRKKELSNKFRNRLNDITGVVTTVFDKEFREYAGLVLKEAKGDFKSWSSDMIANVGERLREYLPRLYKDLGGLDKIGEEFIDSTIEPEVIAEIEKSPEEINAEEIAVFKERLTKAMKASKVTTLIKTGVVKSDLAVDAIKKVSEIVDHKTMLSAARAVKKVFNNVVRNAYISQIDQAKKGLFTRLKGSKLGKTEVVKKFLSIKETQLDIKDLEAYNALARKLNEQYNAKLEGVVADSELQRFVDRIADKTAKKILDEHVEEVAEEKEETEGGVSPRRKQLNAAVEINRQALRKSGYSEQFKRVAKALMGIDTENLSNSEMVNLNLALINLSVNDRLVGHEKVFKDYVGQEGNKTLKEKVGDKIKGLLDNMLGADARSLDVNSKIIFKGERDAAQFQEESGIRGISSANAQVQKIDMKAIEKGYNDLIASLKFKDFNTAANRFLRSLYSIPTQFSSIENEQKDFSRFKSLIKQSAEVLQSSKKPSEQREGNLRMEQYEEYLAPFDERSDFESNYRQKQPQNAKVVDFFREQFESKYGDFNTASQIYAGRNIGKENFYTPIKYKNHAETDVVEDKMSEDIVEPTFTFDPETGDVSARQSSTAIDRTKNAKINPNGRVLDMDFDRVMFQKYREMNYDIRSLKFRHQYNAIKSDAAFNEITGSKNNSKILTKSVLKMVQRTMGQGVSNDAIDKAVRALAPLRAKSVRQALFGVLQTAKQWPSVALRTAINLNTDIDLLHKSIMRVGLNNPIFDQNGIGLRESTRGGTNMELNLGELASADFSSSPIKLAHQINSVSKRVADFLAKPLTLSDNAIAKQSWAAYYMQYIRENGGDVNAIDWKTEHLNQNNDAAAYADLKVSATQNVNDNSKQANLLYDDGNAKTLIRDVIAPYSSFARNSQANFEADLRTFSGGTVAEKKSAAAGIISYVSEQAAFNTIKALIGVYIVKTAANGLLSAFGQPEEPNPTEVGSKVIKNTTTDILFGGLGSMANSLGIRGLNKANKAITGDSKDLFYQYNPSQYSEPDFSLLGVYGGLAQNIYSMGQKADYLDGTLTDNFESKGQEYQSNVKLTDKQQALATSLFYMDVLSLVGLSESEISRINQTAFRSLKKHTEPVKSFQIKYANKKGGAKKEKVE